MIGVELFDRARAAVAGCGFDADMQTRIALFLGATKTVNGALLAAAELLPANSIAYPFMHGQFFRETEFASLLARVTRWSPNPLIYWQAAALTAPLWREWWRIQGMLGTVLDARAAYRGLAYGHALLARVRLTPVMPVGTDELDPFVLALRRIEQENGRMIQAQIRLLKDMPVDLTLAEREEIVAEEQNAVDRVFYAFLEWLAGGEAPAPPFILRIAPAEKERTP